MSTWHLQRQGLPSVYFTWDAAPRVLGIGLDVDEFVSGRRALTALLHFELVGLLRDGFEMDAALQDAVCEAVAGRLRILIKRGDLFEDDGKWRLVSAKDKN